MVQLPVWAELCWILTPPELSGGWTETFGPEIKTGKSRSPTGCSCVLLEHSRLAHRGERVFVLGVLGCERLSNLSLPCRVVQKQMAFMLGRHGVFLELNEDVEEYEDLTEIMSNVQLNSNFLALAREVSFAAGKRVRLPAAVAALAAGLCDKIWEEIFHPCKLCQVPPGEIAVVGQLL